MEFALDLALCLGRTLEELGEMTSAEFSLWQARHRKSPLGPLRADMHAAIVASTIANYAGKRRADSAPIAVPADYMPFLRKVEQATQDGEDDIDGFIGAMG